MSCTFCEIVARSVPSKIVREDDVTLTFLDNRPLFAGHCLVVPKRHYETLPDLPVGLVGPLFSSARLIAAAMPSALGAEGTFVAVNNKVSQSVPHVHVHVVPRRFKDGLRGFFWPRRPYADEAEATRVQRALIAALPKTPG
ncbi:MAG TPA: HIT domain-containing protein [Actinomycetota bacterium]|nr:HIT domain-containing protein [Actinomycetota bacterium]